jgi:hypothetical protein
MVSTDNDLKSEVRTLTDYESKSVLSDTALGEVLGIAKRDIQAEANTSISTWYDTLDKENALFWATCLFTKIKAGELDGIPMSLGDMEYESLRAAGEGMDGNPVIWYEKANRYTKRLKSDSGKFAVSRVDRGRGRKYGSESEFDDLGDEL